MSLSQGVPCERKGCIAGNHHRLGAMFGNQIVEKGYDPFFQFRFRPATDGKGRIVGDIKERLIRQQISRFAQHREPAKT